MRKGRLTSHDRQEIAAGLSAGLGYAEIARRLQRPTSTVSREVNRNGGHNRYRPDVASRAATLRAKRRRETMPDYPPPDSDAHRYGRDPAAVSEFQDRFAAMMLETGFPRMMARVLICLYTSDADDLTAAELAHRLRVSPASISKAIGHLERLGFVRRRRGDRPRRERYSIDADVWDIVWRKQAESLAIWAGIVRAGAEVYRPDTPTGVRLQLMSRFLEFHHREMIEATERWRRPSK
ncbi:helix-turn-helix domain-containing protein [Nocardia sp. NPDC046763]|uniref:GbsR/MarR family transcriptional regulator n=1 Tax=Nocardia sp. NPDC046763 TaxID=3155256 RepID=UPI0033C0FDA1